MTIFLIISGITSILTVFLTQKLIKNEKALTLMLKVCAALIFVIVSIKLLTRGVDDESIIKDVFYWTTKYLLTGRYEGLFKSRIGAILFILFKWLSYITIGTAFVGCLIDGKLIRQYNLFLFPLMIVLNVVLFNTTIYSIVGEYKDREVLHSFLLFLRILVLSFSYALFLKRELMLKDKTRYSFKLCLKSLSILPLLLVLFMPVFAPMNLFGEAGAYSTGYNKYHVIMLIFTFSLLIGSILILRNRSREEIKVFLYIYVFASFFEYFSRYCYFKMPIDIYPMHICNTAVILMLVAMIFKVKSIFYFTYFCNTLGALFALIFPNKGDFFEPGTVEFWYNHFIDFTFPFIAVALKEFERPKIKNMLSALGVFTIYCVLALLMNAYANYEMTPLSKSFNADFFFMYGDKFTSISLVEKFAYSIKYKLDSSGNFKYVVYFNLFGRRVFVYWLNVLLIYLFFIGFSFLLWYIIDRIEQIIEDIKLLNYKTKLKLEKIGKTSKEEILNIKNIMGEKTMVKIEHFSKKYGSSKRYSVEDFNLTIEDGDVFGFIGHNGAGKSTVIKSLVGIQSITEGKIEICGYDIEKYPLQAKLNIGYVSDNHAVYEKLTGREYINYVAELYQVSKEDKEERLKYYSEMFGLTEFLDKEAKGYSHGMKQKLVVIASLIHNPKVWVLDEPLTGLDPTSSYEIKECMRVQAQKGNIVFFSTHVIEVIEKLCTKIAIISHGKLMGVYKIEDLRRDGISLESLYLKYVVGDDKRNKFSEEDIKTTDAGLIIERNNE